MHARKYARFNKLFRLKISVISSGFKWRKLLNILFSLKIKNSLVLIDKTHVLALNEGFELEYMDGVRSNWLLFISLNKIQR